VAIATLFVTRRHILSKEVKENNLESANGPMSGEASDNTDASSASLPKVKADEAKSRAKTAVGVLNSTRVHESVDSGSCVEDASVVEEEEIDSDSSHSSHSAASNEY
jgi:hypothetical protein